MASGVELARESRILETHLLFPAYGLAVSDALPTAPKRIACALTGHCYRMLGSVVDADDAVQETMVRAWRSLDRFDGRSSLRTWLYRIATNVCLDALSDRDAARAPGRASARVGTVDDALETTTAHALARADRRRARAARRTPTRPSASSCAQSIRLAFVAALQHLPPKQRAALLADRGARLVGGRGGRESRDLGGRR